MTAFSVKNQSGINCSDWIQYNTVGADQSVSEHHHWHWLGKSVWGIWRYKCYDGGLGDGVYIYLSNSGVDSHYLTKEQNKHLSPSAPGSIHSCQVFVDHHKLCCLTACDPIISFHPPPPIVLQPEMVILTNSQQMLSEVQRHIENTPFAF